MSMIFFYSFWLIICTLDHDPWIRFFADQNVADPMDLDPKLWLMVRCMLRILQMEVEELFSVLEPAPVMYPVLKISGAVST